MDQSLILAAQNGHEVDVEVLLISGADINCCNVEKLTVLHYASKRNWVRIVRFIISKNFDPDAKTVGGQTAMMFAAQRGNYTVLQLLIGAGANVNCLDKNQWSALHYASLKQHKRIMIALVDKGANINAMNSNGHTPMNLYLTFDIDIETLQYLLNSGADCNIPSNYGNSVFIQLIIRKNMEAVRLCIENGAVLESSDYCKWILEDPLFKNGLLNSREHCTLAMMNIFNNKYLPFLYKVLGSSNILPEMDRIKMARNSGMAEEIDRAVAHQIEKKGFCNLLTVRPLVLSMLCVKSLLVHAITIGNAIALLKQMKPSGSKSGVKRSIARERATKRIHM